MRNVVYYLSVGTKSQKIKNIGQRENVTYTRLHVSNAEHFSLVGYCHLAPKRRWRHLSSKTRNILALLQRQRHRINRLFHGPWRETSWGAAPTRDKGNNRFNKSEHYQDSAERTYRFFFFYYFIKFIIVPLVINMCFRSFSTFQNLSG